MPVEALDVRAPSRRVAGAVIRRKQFEPGPLVAMERAAPIGVGRALGMDEVDVGGVDVALEGLDPVALLQHHERRVDLGRGQRVDLERGEGRRRLAGAQVGPDHAVDVTAGIGPRPHLVLERALLRLVRHVDAAARDVPLPAVIRAAEAAFFIAPEEERSPAMGAVHG